MTHKKGGVSLLEVLIYMAILLVVLVLIMDVITMLTRSQSSIKASKAIEETYISSFDRVVREVRDAIGIHGDSTFGVNIVSSGLLKLNSLDASGNVRTVEFYVDQGVLNMRENGTLLGPLMPASVRITSLVFRSINTGPTRAVRMEMVVESGVGSAYKTSNLQTTAILRGSY